MENLLTREEAARMLGVSTDTLDRLRKRGSIAYIQHVPNGKVWFTEAAIVEYIARGTHAARPVQTAVQTYRKRRTRVAV